MLTLLVLALPLVGLMLLSTRAEANSMLGPNLAPNSSFENGVGMVPDAWIPNPNGTDASFLWDKSLGHTGSSSVKISTSQRVAPLANPGWKTSGFIPIDLTKTYQASFFTYTSDGGVGHIPAIQFFAADNTFLGTVGAVMPSGITDPLGVWVKKTFTIDLSTHGPPSATKVQLLVVQDINDTQGTVTTVNFDDVFFGEVRDVAAIPSPFTDLLGDKDGFGMGRGEGAIAPSPQNFDNREADDPFFTDVWSVPWVGTFPSGSISYTHTWASSSEIPIGRATLSLLTQGIQDGDSQVVGRDQDLRLFIDNVEVPKAFDEIDQFDFFPGIGYAEIVGLVQIEIPEDLFPLLADSQAEIRIESHSSGPSAGLDGIAIDYSEFSVSFNLNDKFAPLGPGDVTTAFSRTPCGGASAGTFTVTATFTNTSVETLSNLLIMVETLTGGNVLCNANGGPGGAGATLTVPLQGDLADGQLSPGESFVVELPIGLQSFNPFTFFVDVLGEEAP